MNEDIGDEELDFEYAPEGADANFQERSLSSEGAWFCRPDGIIWSDNWLTSAVRRYTELEHIKSTDSMFLDRDIR